MELIHRIAGIIVPVFMIVAVGYVYGRKARPDLTSFNRIALDVLSPMLVYTALASRDFRWREQLPLLAAGALLILLTGAAAWAVARGTRTPARTLVPVVMFTNCGNMGLPLAVLAFGQAGFPAMVALFTISNLLQFTLGTWLMDHRARFGNLLRNPMVGATIVGFAFALIHPPMPEWTMTGIRMVGDALIPVMLISLGVRLADVRWSDWHLGVIGGIVCPVAGLACALVLAPVLGLDELQRGLLILFSVLPPAVLNFMVAEQFKQEPGKVASIVLIGNIMSVLFVPLGLALVVR